MVSTTTFLAAILAAALPLVSATPITPVAARAASPDPAPAPAPAPVPVPAPILVDSNGDGGEIQNFTHFLLTARAAPRWISGPWWNFPDISTWLSFDDLFGRNMNSMHSTGSTWDDIGRINVAIRECAKLGVDERVILAIIMQESHGDVGVRTTTSPGGAATAGIMQCTGCPGFPGRHGLSQVSLLLYVPPVSCYPLSVPSLFGLRCAGYKWSWDAKTS